MSSLFLPLLCLAAVIGTSASLQAAPAEPAPDPATQSIRKQEPKDGPDRRFDLDSVEFRELPPPETRLTVPDFSASRVIRKHSRTVSTGMWSGTLIDSENLTVYGLRLDFQNDNSNETGQSFGLTVLTNNLWGAHWDYQTNCCLGAYWEPYWSLGFGSLWAPSESLASFVNLDRYFLRARAGLEDVFGLRRRLRLEAAIQWGRLGLSGYITAGWTWGQDEFWF